MVCRLSNPQQPVFSQLLPEFCGAFLKSCRFPQLCGTFFVPKWKIGILYSFHLKFQWKIEVHKGSLGKIWIDLSRLKW